MTYDFNAEWRHRSPGELLLVAEQFWLVPPALQPLAYYRLAALAVEACERLLAVVIVDGDAGQEVA